MTDDTRLIDAFWTTIAAHGWRGVSAARLAAASGLPAGELLSRFPSRLDLLRMHDEALDQAVAAGTVPGQGGTPRDRLFDVLMRRIDGLQPYRAGLVRLFGEMRRDPVLALTAAPLLRASMRRVLEMAELDASGPAGEARALGLVGVWLMTLRAWEGDGSEDLGITMAALDRALDRAEQAARSLGLGPGDRAG